MSSVQYSNLSSPPSVLTASSSNGTYAGTLSDANTNSVNVPTSQIQSISGAVAHRGGRRRSRRQRQRHTQRGGRRKRRQTRRRRN